MSLSKFFCVCGPFTFSNILLNHLLYIKDKQAYFFSFRAGCVRFYCTDTETSQKVIDAFTF